MANGKAAAPAAAAAAVKQEAAAPEAAAAAAVKDEAAAPQAAAAGEAAAAEKAEEAAEEEAIPQFVPGLLVRFDFGEAEHDLSYEDIKGAFGRAMAYVEFQKARCKPLLLQALLHSEALCCCCMRWTHCSNGIRLSFANRAGQNQDSMLLGRIVAVTRRIVS
jgi:hypothetical protein